MEEINSKLRLRNDVEIDLLSLGRLFWGYTAVKNVDIYVPYTKCRDWGYIKAFQCRITSKEAAKNVKLFFHHSLGSWKMFQHPICFTT